MEKFDLIMRTPVEELGVEQKEFLNIHNTILYYGTNVCINLYQMAKQLELMKDTKAYLNAGFESFESYAEDCLGLKRSQVYNYIKVANSYSNEFLLNNSKIGVTKLLVLSELDEPVVEKVIETIEVEDKTVSDLKNVVKSLKQELKEEKNKQKDVKEKYKTEIDKLKEEINSLKNLNQVLDEVDETNNSDLEERIKKLEEELFIKQKEIAELESNSKTFVINFNPHLIKFRVKFDDLQRNLIALKELLPFLDNESKTKCITALNTVLRGAICE